MIAWAPMTNASSSPMDELVRQVSLADSYADVLTLIRKRNAAATRPLILSFINAHAYNMCCKDQQFYKALAASDILLRDGKGMQFLYKAIGMSPGINTNGTDLIPEMLKGMIGKTIALLGTSNPYLQKAAGNLSEQGLNVVLLADGFQSPEAYLCLVQEHRPDIVLLGMGMPKQELVSLLLKEKAGYPCLVINGGAIIDFIGKKISRAPQWMRANGLEWLYRLLKEPRRLFRRYVIGNVLFLFRMLLHKRSQKKYELYHS